MQKSQLDAMILEWHKAFVALKGREPERLPIYQDGWFIWKTFSGFTVSRVRLPVFQNTIRNLCAMDKRRITDSTPAKVICVSNRSKNKTRRYSSMPVFTKKKARSRYLT